MLCNMEELYSVFGENVLLTLVISNDHRLTLDPITLVEGLKLINIYESYGQDMQDKRVIAFLVKMTF